MASPNVANIYELYQLSEEYGFLLPNPLSSLPNDFANWNNIGQKLPELLKSKSLRQVVHQLAELDPSVLSSVEELRCAYMFLTFITNGYVWQDGDAGVPTVLPRQLSVPLDRISRRLGLQPILCHAATVLSNWGSNDKSASFEKIQTVVNLEDSGGSDWFFRVTWLVEYTFAPALKWILSGVDAALVDNVVTLQKCLTEVTQIVRAMTVAVSRMHEKLSADVFYNHVRPYLGGWGGPTSPLKHGLIYEGVSEDPVEMTGGSAAQSSTVQALDAFLGIVHNRDDQAFLDKMMTYMPPPHARFIKYLRDTSKVKEFVSHKKNSELNVSYAMVIKAMEDFRSYHIKIVAKYVVAVSSKQRETQFESLAKTGTGGQALIPFLKSIRESTRITLRDRKEQDLEEVNN